MRAKTRQPALGTPWLLWLGLLLLALALGFEMLWLARNPQPDGGMVFSIGRLGLRLTLSRAGFEAFALAAGALALGSVAWAFFAARSGLGGVGGEGEGAEGARAEIGNRQSEIADGASPSPRCCWWRARCR